MALTVGSTALNGALAWCMFKGAKLHRSIALEGEGHHLLVDVWTSAGVVLGLLLVQWLHWTWLDPVAALLVAANILKEGVRLLWRSSQGLMDEAASPEVQQQIEQILSTWRLQYGDQIRMDHLRTRQVGAYTELDLHVHLPENWTLAQAAALRSELVQNLTRHIGELKTTVQLLPMNVEA
jgi:cation diffusion facilitator family transporter